MEQLTYLETHLVHHCNLNCVGCTHFAPLADDTWLASVEGYKRDIKRIFDFHFPISVIKLLGGEPLLHPDIIDFIAATRYHFSGRLSIVTNGLLLLSMGKDFWKEIRDYRVVIDLTKYPYGPNKEKVQSLSEKQKIEICTYDMPNMRVRYLNPIRSLHSENNFKKCRMARCKTLLNGRLYPCSLGTYASMLNEKFHTVFPPAKGIDIHDDRVTRDHILRHINSPISLCKHCITDHIPLSKWRKSELIKEEWVV